MYAKLCSFLIAAAAAIAFSVGVAHAGKRDDVQAIMSKAAAHYQSVGKAQAIKDFSDADGGFRSGELYVVVQSTDGVVIAHPANSKLNGKNLIGIKDTDGTPFVKEMCDIASTKGEGWTEYKWVHPETKKIAAKTSMVKRVENGIFLIIGYYN